MTAQVAEFLAGKRAAHTLFAGEMHRKHHFQIPLDQGQDIFAAVGPHQLKQRCNQIVFVQPGQHIHASAGSEFVVSGGLHMESGGYDTGLADPVGQFETSSQILGHCGSDFVVAVMVRPFVFRSFDLAKIVAHGHPAGDGFFSEQVNQLQHMIENAAFVKRERPGWYMAGGFQFRHPGQQAVGFGQQAEKS